MIRHQSPISTITNNLQPYSKQETKKQEIKRIKKQEIKLYLGGVPPTKRTI